MALDHLATSPRPTTRANPPRPPFPAAWLTVLEQLPFYRELDVALQARLRHDLHVLVTTKRWLGHDLVVTDAMKVTIAAQAALLTVALDHEHYPNVHTIVLYPTHLRTTVTATGRLLRDEVGETRRDGTIVLAWDEAVLGARCPHDGRNLVYHEFAHALDLQDGKADGRPPMLDRAAASHWARVIHSHLASLRTHLAANDATLLDGYGATNSAELFAVATECFFERGRELAEQDPQLYLLLWRFYRQDPAARPCETIAINGGARRPRT